MFTVTHTDGAARCGVLDLPHGALRTPVFMPVGTGGTVKAVSVDALREIGFQIILSNTYHLYLRPGTGVLQAADGLHHFMNWDRNILTDSGGFQVFSLAAMRKVTEEGFQFRSHIDGSAHRLRPEDVVDIQRTIGSDIQMQLDVCTPPGIDRKAAEEALRITNLWMGRAVKRWKEVSSFSSDNTTLRASAPPRENSSDYRGLLFSIVQGNFFKDLRRQSAEACIAADTPGIAIGGLSVGEEPAVFEEFLASTAALLPPEKPRYVMGIGTPEYILQAIEAGIDMFDCVLPTRCARNGRLLTGRGNLSIKREECRLDMRAPDEGCGCMVCRNYSRSYLRHLFKSGEILYSMLASYHNLYFLNHLVLEARQAIEEGRFAAFKRDFLARYHNNEEI
jgi:queuine tRNA-ribosyltransferase